MEQIEIINALINHGIERLTAKTRYGTFSITAKSSLVAKQVDNRSSADWKKAQYVIVDNNHEDTSISLEKCINGWKSMAEECQFLIINDNGEWNFYNYEGRSVSFDEILTHNNNILPLQKIYFGSPGTGKSFTVKHELSEVPEDNIFRITFHPDTDYASFVGSYKPLKDDDGRITYDYEPQAFTCAYIRAWQHPSEAVYLVIEEINRGNCAQIFGDLFQLLDRKNGVSEYPVNADAALTKYLKNKLTGDAAEGIANNKLKLPKNLNIIATMNTSDQSLFPMDSAFKRRWDWVYFPTTSPKTKEEGGKIEDKIINVGDSEYKWTEFLNAINKRISAVTHSDDKQIGFWFVKTPEGVNEITVSSFVSKVIFYLWNDVFKEIGPKKENPFTVNINDKDQVMPFSSFFEINSVGAVVENIGVLHTFMKNLGLTPTMKNPAGDAPETGDEKEETSHE